MFERESSTYTYLLAPQRGREALLIDPVKEELPKYLQLIDELDLRLVFALDTHVHADHVTALGDLRANTHCVTVMGEQTRAECVSLRLIDGERLRIDGIDLQALYTPGHTDDSYSFVLPDRVFTGDTLLIRGTGRTDFQNGDPRAQYHSLFDKLLRMPDETLVYPAHDYKGWTVSTIAEERAHNPRLQVASEQAYVEMMNNLKLANPKMMDVAVPANLGCGVAPEQQ
jgi:glyoxylase-like metal-dependent hydrolase (beta-lactamase superfamily II)